MQVDHSMIYTVSQINSHVKKLIDGDLMLQQIVLKGEISNFTNHIKTGHFYFTIKDESCSIKAVMFRPNASRVGFSPENGIRVLLVGSVQVFARDGVVQFYCEQMQPDGIGALSLAFEQLKQKLSQDGLFDLSHKKPLPEFPHKIGVVTAKTGAAFGDIITVLERRYPLATVVLFPVLVQGESAASSICDGIVQAQQYEDIDVLIVGRGGGSMEDLWCFNDERVARAVYACSIPVVSAVGHEIDITMVDFAADLRAPTPTAAAELCTPDHQQLRQNIKTIEMHLAEMLDSYVQKAQQQLHTLTVQLQLCSPEQELVQQTQCLKDLFIRLQGGVEHTMERKLSGFLHYLALLEALSPLKVLLRGYSLTYHEDRILTSAKQVEQGDQLQTRLADGVLISVVTSTDTSNA